MKFLAMLRDAFRETLDCKTFWVLLVVVGILVLLCWSVSFTPLSPEEALKDVAGGFNVLMHTHDGRYDSRDYGVTFEVAEARRLDDGAYAFVLKVSPAGEYQRMVRRWDALASGKIEKIGDPVTDEDAPVGFEVQRRFLGDRFRRQLLAGVGIEKAPSSGDAFHYSIRLRPGHQDLLTGAYRMGILFGLYGFRLPASVALVVFLIESILANFFAGWAGLIFAFVVTASFVPDMLQKGRIDTLLSRPIPRPTLLVYKYTGGLIYVLLLAVVLIGGCWLGLAVRSGHWNASFLWCIPLVVLSFAVLYSFSTWLAVLARNTLVPILGTIGLWFLSWGISTVRTFIASEQRFANISSGIRTAIDFVYYVMPKVTDLGKMGDYLILSGSVGEEGMEAMQVQLSMEIEPEWTLVLASSGAFIVFFVALSCLTFSRRDY